MDEENWKKLKGFLIRRIEDMVDVEANRTILRFMNKLDGTEEARDKKNEEWRKSKMKKPPRERPKRKGSKEKMKKRLYDIPGGDQGW